MVSTPACCRLLTVFRSALASEHLPGARIQGVTRHSGCVPFPLPAVFVPQRCAALQQCTIEALVGLLLPCSAGTQVGKSTAVRQVRAMILLCGAFEGALDAHYDVTALLSGSPCMH